MTTMAKTLFSESGIKSISFNVLSCFFGTVTMPANCVTADKVEETLVAKSLLLDFV